MDKLYIIVPAYNEAENIEEFIEEWYPIINSNECDPESRLVIISDGSTDDTYNIVKKHTEKKDRLIALEKKNSGHGGTLIYGYMYALDNGADYIFQTDSDRQTVPGEFNLFWDKRYDYDAIIGCRKNRQDGMQRVFVEKMLLFMLYFFFGVRIPDANAPYRLMKSELVEKYIYDFQIDYNLPNVMFTTFFAFYHEKIKFVNITFKPRKKGTNSINISKIIKIGFKSVKDFYFFGKRMKNCEYKEQV